MGGNNSKDFVDLDDESALQGEDLETMSSEMKQRRSERLEQSAEHRRTGGELRMAINDLSRRLESIYSAILEFEKVPATVLDVVELQTRAIELFLAREVPAGYTCRILSTPATVKQNDSALNEMKTKLKPAIEGAKQLSVLIKQLQAIVGLCVCHARTVQAMRNGTPRVAVDSGPESGDVEDDEGDEII